MRTSIKLILAAIPEVHVLTGKCFRLKIKKALLYVEDTGEAKIFRSVSI